MPNMKPNCNSCNPQRRRERTRGRCRREVLSEDSSGWTYVHEQALQSVPGCACLYALWHLGQWCLECERRCPRRLKRWHERAQQHGHRTLQADVRSWNGGGASSNGWSVSWHNRATPIDIVVSARPCTPGGPAWATGGSAVELAGAVCASWAHAGVEVEPGPVAVLGVELEPGVALGAVVASWAVVVGVCGGAAQLAAGAGR